MLNCIRTRNRHVIESIGKTVREAAVDEEGHTKEQNQRLSLAGESNNGGHDETATYCQQTGIDRTHLQATFKYRLCRSAKFQW